MSKIFLSAFNFSFNYYQFPPHIILRTFYNTKYPTSAICSLHQLFGLNWFPLFLGIIEFPCTPFIVVLVSVFSVLFAFFFRFHLTDTLLPSFITFRDSCLTLPAPIPDEEKKLTYIFIFTFLCGSSKGFTMHQKEVRK